MLVDTADAPTVYDDESKYKVTYNKGVMTTESADLRQLKVEKEEGSMVVQVFVDEANAGFISLRDVDNSLKNEQFVVESVPYSTKHDCKDSTLHLIYFCTGQIQLREMTPIEKAKY